MICFRADGNAHIGSGHIMRCLSLAAALRTLGEDCLFAMADDTMAATVRSRGFEVRILGTYWRDMNAELPVFLPLAAQAKLVVVDSYALTPAWLEAVRQAHGFPVITGWPDEVVFFLFAADFRSGYAVNGGRASVPAEAERLFRSGATLVVLRPCGAPGKEADYAGKRFVLGSELVAFDGKTAASCCAGCGGLAGFAGKVESKWNGIFST